MKMDTSHPEFSLYRFMERGSGKYITGIVEVDTDKGTYTQEVKDPNGKIIKKKRQGYLIPIKDLNRVDDSSQKVNPQNDQDLYVSFEKRTIETPWLSSERVQVVQ